jgi:hypothetical protein
VRYLVINAETENIVSEWDTQKLAEDAARRTKAITKEEYIVQPTCPQCDSDDVIHAHSAETFAYPETDYWVCAACSHQWGHE